MSAPRPTAGVTRRTSLALVLTAPLAALAACSAAQPTQAPVPSEGPDARSDEPGLLQQQARLEAGLVARYDALIAAFPDSPDAGLLAEFRDHHVQHAVALGGAAPADGPLDPIPRTSAAAFADLARVEREQATARIRACVDAADPQAARLLSLIAAAEAAHVPALLDARDAS